MAHNGVTPPKPKGQGGMKRVSVPKPLKGGTVQKTAGSGQLKTGPTKSPGAGTHGGGSKYNKIEKA